MLGAETCQRQSSGTAECGRGGRVVSDVLLRDLIAIPDEVHAGDFVLALAKGVGEKSTITDYVVTGPLERTSTVRSA